MLLGDYIFEIIPDTEFWLDGGAMFGVIPRVLWEKVAPADGKNRIRMNMNCAFLDTGKDKILIETGIGEKWTDKQTKMYGITRERPFSDSLFEITGRRPEDITIVVNTHLHFDHAGGNSVPLSRRSPTGVAVTDRTLNVPQFKNARYLVSGSELTHAESPHERDRASYLPENWRPIQQSGQLEQMPDDYEVVPGLKVQTVRGHSETMQTWRLDRGGYTVYGFADLIPMKHHVALPWIAGFDLYPTETLAFKKEVLPQAVRENWLCLFYHDIDTPLCRVVQEENKLGAVPVN
jgi:glyoxylase-like metal-dependent hydrolase (beta-lactamase superfamily II)